MHISWRCHTYIYLCVCLCLCVHISFTAFLSTLRQFSPAQETCYWTVSLTIILALSWRDASWRSTLWRSWCPLTFQNTHTGFCRASPTPGKLLLGFLNEGTLGINCRLQDLCFLHMKLWTIQIKYGTFHTKSNTVINLWSYILFPNVLVVHEIHCNSLIDH